jgi:hypothetical protein
MNLKLLSNQLTKIYNTLGNQWIVDNFISEPFVFRVFVRKGDFNDLHDYEVEIYTDRPFPQNFEYREKKKFDGAHHSTVNQKFKDLTNYVERFGDFRKTLGVKFMDLSYK